MQVFCYKQQQQQQQQQQNTQMNEHPSNRIPRVQGRLAPPALKLTRADTAIRRLPGSSSSAAESIDTGGGGFKVPVIRSQDGKIDKDVIEKTRKYLNQRLQVLDANKSDRCLNGDDAFSAWKDYEALSWLADENPDRNQEHEYVYLFISSAMRDPFAFPNAGNFRIGLSAEVDNIIKAELVQASIPLVDPTVNTANYILRYSFPPHVGAAVVEIKIPVGSYLGKHLGPEITRQMNQSLFAVDIAANTYIIDDDTGLVLDPATEEPPVGVTQFRCTFNENMQRFTFQMIDDDELPVNTTVFAIHIQPRPPITIQVPYRYMNDDIYELLGFNRILYQEQAEPLGQFDPDTQTYYLLNTDNDPLFNGLFEIATSVDTRFRYSLHSNQAADLRGNIAVVLDIDPLNDNDIARVRDSAGTGALTLSDFFGFILLRDPAGVTDRMVEVNNNSYPIKKYYREGRSRMNQLTVIMRRPDGTIFNFAGVNFYMTIRLVVTRTQPPKPMFVRGS